MYHNKNGVEWSIWHLTPPFELLLGVFEMNCFEGDFSYSSQPHNKILQVLKKVARVVFWPDQSLVYLQRKEEIDLSPQTLSFSKDLGMDYAHTLCF